MQSSHLFLCVRKLNLLTTVLEVLAVEVHHEMFDDSGIVIDSVMLGCLGTPISISSVICIT